MKPKKDNIIITYDALSDILEIIIFITDEQVDNIMLVERRSINETFESELYSYYVNDVQIFPIQLALTKLSVDTYNMR